MGSDAPGEHIAADLTSAADCARMVATAVAALGTIDIVCNTAGIDPPSATTALDTSEADWDRIMAVNLKGVFLACKAVLPVMLERRRGVIVNVASQGALLALPAMTAYGVAKAGVLQLTRQIAVDYAGQGIRANCVCPSGLVSPSRDRLTALSPDALERRGAVMAAASPLGRVCQPEDVAGAMLYLASDLSGYVTGVALPVEGGATSRLRF
jgi:NAD(P)-dependent dehydrogenase (short-subunit alcohol dehydrogenase family)